MSNPSTPAPPDPKKLAAATLVAVLVAGVVLVGAVVPAEYGIDPTGIGRATGLARLSDPTGGARAEPQVESAGNGARVLHAVEARWEVVEHPVTVHDGLNEGEFTTTKVALPLQVTNLTKVTARLDWWDNDTLNGQRTDPDLFELSLHAPGGRASQPVQADNGPDGHGSVTVSLAWRSVPVPEKNGTTGRLALPLLAPDESSRGDWTFNVRLYAARGHPNATEDDPGNAWRLTVTAEAYELVLHEEEGPAGDRVQITLGPDEGVEYKFHMRPGARLQYAWAATAPLYYDLHAEEDGKNPEDFTRFAEGTSAGERGSLTASFNGNHGWFWENEGPTPVTITLETRGEYAIVGVPR